MKIATLYCLSIFYLVEVLTYHLRLGKVTPTSKLIYKDEVWKNLRPWVRMDDIVLDAEMGFVITAINITDLGSCQDGIVYIESGGIGTRKTVIVMESAGPYKGFHFYVKVYANRLDDVEKEQGLGLKQGGNQG